MGALPFVIAIGMFALQPGMLDFYLHDLVGQIILGVCLLSVVFGLVLIRDIANISD
jgi:Flp pilus assembly protein TadB